MLKEKDKDIVDLKKRINIPISEHAQMVELVEVQNKLYKVVAGN